MVSPQFFLLGILLSAIMGCLSGFGATHTLTTHTNGNGTVARNPTNSVYPNGSVVTITALPASGWAFASWSGDASGTVNPLNVTMDADKVITATFSQVPTCTLTVSVVGNGSVNPPGGSYLSNSTVQLTATPASGWVFDSWSGAVNGSANPVQVVMNGNRTVNATFGELPYVITHPHSTNVSPGATVTLSVVGAGSSPVLYQWQLFGNALNGETNDSLVLTNLQASGDYRVRLSNPYGSTTSQVGVVTVDCVGTNVVGTCSDAALRQAISVGGLIRLCCDGTIVLTNTIAVNKNVTLDGSGSSTVISGNNVLRLFQISPGVTFTVTNVVLAAGRVVGTNGLTATSGSAAQPGEPAGGAGILNNGGTVRLIRCVLRDHRVAGGQGGAGAFVGPAQGAMGGLARGAAVFNNGGAVHVTECIVTNNIAVGGVGGTSPGSFFQAGSGATSSGGAVFNLGGIVRVENSIAISNVANGGLGGAGSGGRNQGGDGGGGFLASFGGDITITNCTFVGNQVIVPAASAPMITSARAEGGAIAASGVLGVASSEFNGNAAIGAEGSSAGRAAGGAIAFTQGIAQIVGSHFTANRAQGGDSGGSEGVAGNADGGAIYNFGLLTIAEARLTGNQAIGGGKGTRNGVGSGGGLFNSGTGSVVRALFDRNVALGGMGGKYLTSIFYSGSNGLGGGMANVGFLALTNTSVVTNFARGGDAYANPGSAGPGSSAGDARGGGVYNTAGTLLGMNVTIAANILVAGAFDPLYANDGGKTSALLGANVANTNGNLTLRNSLLAYPGTNANAWGTVTDGGYNMSSDGSANFSSGSSFNFTDPKLLPLANYGGMTPTMALALNSPAIDWAPLGDAPATDQRGFPRPYGDGVDVGAFEAGPPTPVLSISRNATNVTLSFPGQAGFNYRIEHSADLLAWELHESTGVLAANGVVSRTIAGSSARQFFRVLMEY